MRDSLQPGAAAEARHRVVTENLVSFRKPGMPPVLCTPWLLQIMEDAAFAAVAAHLDPGEASVGAGFQFEHLAPTPCGETVVATARITEVEGRRVTLAIEARDNQATVARGTHVRAVIDLEKFKTRLKRRANA